MQVDINKCKPTHEMEQQFDKLCLHTLRNRRRLSEDDDGSSVIARSSTLMPRQRPSRYYPPPLDLVDTDSPFPIVGRVGSDDLTPGNSPLSENGENGDDCELRTGDNWVDGVFREDCITNAEEDEQLSKDVQKEIEERDFAVLRSNSVHMYRLSRTGSQLLSPTMLAQISEIEEKREELAANCDQDSDSVLPMEQLEKDYADIMKLRIFELAGDDLDGRPVIAFSMSNLPPSSEIDHHRLFKFVRILLDRYVENDYVVVYFHCGLNSKNKPPMKILMQEFMDLDPKYKKNLKALLLVHPTKFIKTIMKVFYPVMSNKFGKKIRHINSLEQLQNYLRLDQLHIPKDVLKHDKDINKLHAKHHNDTLKGSLKRLVDHKTKQFGVPLSVLLKKSEKSIPIVVALTVDFITHHALSVEGIFRRSAQSSTIKAAVDTFNSGSTFEFTAEHVYLAPTLLKKFLRDLPEPLLTFDLYDRLIDSTNLSDRKVRLAFLKQVLNDELPDENRFVLIFLLQFLLHVIAHTSLNKMDSGSLAIVLGPNLLWSKTESSSLPAMSKINSFTKFLIDNSNLIFNIIIPTNIRQFGISLSALKEITRRSIPVVVQSIVEYIQTNALDEDGIFRRSAQASIVDEAVETLNNGSSVDFVNYDVHLGPAVLKRFLRDLPEPLLTFGLYDRISEWCEIDNEPSKLEFTKCMLTEIPSENYDVLMLLLNFFALVTRHSSKNQMNPMQLAFAVGPNLLWSPTGATDAGAAQVRDPHSRVTTEGADNVNHFTQYLIENYAFLLQ